MNRFWATYEGQPVSFSELGFTDHPEPVPSERWRHEIIGNDPKTGEVLAAPKPDPDDYENHYRRFTLAAASEGRLIISHQLSFKEDRWSRTYPVGFFVLNAHGPSGEPFPEIFVGHPTGRLVTANAPLLRGEAGFWVDPLGLPGERLVLTFALPTALPTWSDVMRSPRTWVWMGLILWIATAAWRVGRRGTLLGHRPEVVPALLLAVSLVLTYAWTFWVLGNDYALQRFVLRAPPHYPFLVPVIALILGLGCGTIAWWYERWGSTAR